MIQQGHDFWTLGVLLYECLYGVTPFQQENQEDTMSMILYANVAFPGNRTHLELIKKNAMTHI
jgi:serine/threonine protein kinase